MKELAATLLTKYPFSPSKVTANFPKNKYRIRNTYGVRSVRIKPAYVYYLRITFPHLTVYKIGYTSTSVRSRIRWMNLPDCVEVDTLCVLTCRSARSAYYLEQLLHLHFREYRYRGQDLLNSGNTELYVCPLV